MENPKRQIIINEILFWKQNKLLPEQYCDFLLTLYMEGEGIEEQDNISFKKSIIVKEKRKKRLFSLGIILFSIALLALLFFLSSYYFVIGAIVVGIVAILFIIYSYKFAKKHDFITPILQVAAALLIFGISVKVSLVYFENNNVVLYSLLIANCLMWTITGVRLKLLYFTISGVLGLLIIIGYQIFFLS
ncbi:hypothetical protein ACFPN4_00905 [Ureibacillus thermophilus]|uniref:hypothetical protein n=1 Tax=Ureibacillus thermophilus TaxID=367743 RepID=UPI0036217475